MRMDASIPPAAKSPKKHLANRGIAVVWMACVALMCGCSGGNSLVAIEGSVQVDGTPVDEGLISFLPEDGAGPSAQAKVTGGTYHVDVAPGKKIVRIQGFEIVGHEHAVRGNPNSPLLPVRKNVVPKKYNEESELRRTIGDGSNPLDFDLSSS